MKHLIVLILLAGTIWIYDTDGNRKGFIEKDGYHRIEIYDKDYNRTGHIRKDGNRWIEIYDKDYNRTGHIRKDGNRWYEYDKDWNRIRMYDEDRIIEYEKGGD